jgi:hypothetical protein
LQPKLKISLILNPPRVDHLDVVRGAYSINDWKPRIHSAPLTHEPGRAVALGRVILMTRPNFNDLFMKRTTHDSNDKCQSCFQRILDRRDVDDTIHLQISISIHQCYERGAKFCRKRMSPIISTSLGLTPRSR